MLLIKRLDLKETHTLGGLIFKNRPLPYFEYLDYYFIADNELTNIDFINGSIDYINISSSNFSMIKEKELSGEGDFKIFKAQPLKPTPSPLHIAFNFDAKNPALAKLFQTLEFRESVEYAIDRDRIIEVVYNGLAVWGGTPVLPSNKSFYNPAIENIRRGYDIKKAKEKLESIGLKDADGDGVLNFESGENISIILTTSTVEENKNAAYLISEMLKEIGLKIDLQILEPNLGAQKILSSDYELSLWAFGNQPDPQLRKAIWQPGNPLYYAHLSTFDKANNKAIKEKMLDWELEVFDAFGERSGF